MYYKKFRGLIFSLFIIVLSNNFATAHAESIELIKNGKVAAVATAIYYDDDATELKERLFRLTVLINQSLILLSGDNFTPKEADLFKNRIKIKVSSNIKQDVYTFWVVKTDDGKELRISGNNIENTERGIYYFLTKHLNIPEENYSKLKEFIDTTKWLDVNNAPLKGIEKLPYENLQWPKIDNFVYEQEDMEIRQSASSPAPE